MKLAFVWKWGSWKTTITSNFIKFLIKNNKKVIAIDADINVWLSDNLWIKIEKEKYISKSEISKNIRKFLIWENKKIKNEDYFVKTTPPANGSNIITFNSKDFFKDFCSFQNENLKFFHVWTYEKEWIWISCYHTNLSILENILSHCYTNNDEFFIVDMVAWNDSFSNTLHSQFDTIFLIVEPTMESISMAKKFLELAKEETTSNISLIANKIEDNEDLEFIEKSFWNIFASFSYDKNIKKLKREWKNEISEKSEIEMKIFFEKIEKNIEKNPEKILKNLHKLHKKYKELDYIKNPLWDLEDQIDLEFSFKNYVKS